MVKKVFINWAYLDNPRLHDPQVWEAMVDSKKRVSWVATKNLQEADLYLSCDNVTIPHGCKCPKVLWLYEPKVILPGIHDQLRKTKTNFNYIFSCEKGLILADNNLMSIKPHFPSFIGKNEQSLYTKTKNISMISSVKNMSDGHKLRNDIANKLSNVVDLFGRGRSRPLNRKVDGLKDYRFSVQIENCKSDNYFTEKILDCFLTGCIPIYYGTDHVKNIFNPRGIITLDEYMATRNTFNYEEEYNKRFDAVKENYDIALAHNTSFLDGVEDIIKTAFPT